MVIHGNTACPTRELPGAVQHLQYRAQTATSCINDWQRGAVACPPASALSCTVQISVLTSCSSRGDQAVGRSACCVFDFCVTLLCASYRLRFVYCAYTPTLHHGSWGPLTLSVVCSRVHPSLRVLSPPLVL
eukprot:3426785-Prymnesium_polylepis.1